MVVKTITGPLLTDLDKIGLGGDQLDLATAFYSKRALESLEIKARKVRFLVRLDLKNPQEWKTGVVNPSALLQIILKLKSQNIDVTLLVSPYAHAKLYVGERAALFGSANLTLNGFGGGLEIVSLSSDRPTISRMRSTLDEYAMQFRKVEVDELQAYITKHKEAIPDRIKKGNCDSDHLPVLKRDDLGFLGSYVGFKDWLSKEQGVAAKEVYDRALGKSNLSGHINRNFYGLRQLFLAFPKLISVFSQKDANAYRLSKDSQMEGVLADFVAHYAVDEKDGLSVSIWKTYLPNECGGKAAKHGGTIGNLNRMLPLVARYLECIGVK